MVSDFDADVALDALGLLGHEDRDALHQALKDGGAPGAIAMYEAAAAGLAWNSPVDPPPALRDKLMGRIADTVPRRVAPALSFIMNDEGWRPHPVVGGIRFKQLALDTDRGIATLLLKVDPGTVYPAHHHNGHEECYVIDGDVVVAGRRLTAGDFHHADGGSHHEPLRTEGGCTVLLVVDARDYQ